MANDWYELWSNETLDPPYILIVVSKEGEDGAINIYDPREAMRLVYAAATYQAAKDWLWEDEYTRVDGRMYRE
ncbi:hypothetical protein [Tuwongella immobilis]|uniref:hypothetical protein n=1 Tax=Tuwongella immobilis TaxID=692036 RepID=UPI0013A6B0F9|nr:hypothetical protein [Tuwongella immobilis]